MKLISCYIENFGKFNEFEYRFDEGLNIIEEDNGWGKTTLAAFIKAMFYGLEYSRGRKMTDRKRYYPWNGGKFGGNLVFEYQERHYRIERFFGRREKEDSFKLYNAKLNQPCADFGENIGGQIWELDRDSYDKTAFITLDGESLFTDLISSKLGDLPTSEADFDSASQALATIEAALKNISSSRGNKGRIQQLEARRDEVRTQLQHARIAQAQIEELEEQIELEKTSLQNNRKQLAQLEDRKGSLNLVDRKTRYQELLGEYNIVKERYTRLNRLFAGDTRDLATIKEELQSISTKVRDYYQAEALANQSQLSEDDSQRYQKLAQVFSQRVPSSFELDQSEGDALELAKLKRDLDSYISQPEELDLQERLEKRYGNLTIDSGVIEGYIRDFDRVTRIDHRIVQINYDMEKNKLYQPRKIRSPQIALLVVGLLVIVSGFIALSTSQALGTVLFGAGLAILFLAAFMMIKERRTATKLPVDLPQTSNEHLAMEKANLESERRTLEERYLAFLNSIGLDDDNIPIALTSAKGEYEDYLELKDEIARKSSQYLETKAVIEKLERQISGFLAQYLKLLEDSDYGRLVKTLRNAVTEYRTLQKCQSDYLQARTQVEGLQVELEAIFTGYYGKSDQPFDQLFNQLNLDLASYQTSQTQLRQLQFKKSSFESNNDIAALKRLEIDEVDLEKITREIDSTRQKLTKAQEEIMRRIAGYQKDIVTLALKADETEDLESLVVNLAEKKKDLAKEKHLLEITLAAMRQAQESLQSRYTADVSKSFKQYLDELNALTPENYQVDNRLNVKMEAGGELHGSDELSTGMKDLIQVCLRMALVDAVFKDVTKPVLILDDPFVNLDNVRLERALELLKKIATNYQVIYFICHSSRNLDSGKELR